MYVAILNAFQVCSHLYLSLSLFFKTGHTVRMLLKVAKQTVPRLEWKRTPVILRATAGLRLLPAEKAQSILDQVNIATVLRYDILLGSLFSRMQFLYHFVMHHIV